MANRGRVSRLLGIALFASLLGFVVSACGTTSPSADPATLISEAKADLENDDADAALPKLEQAIKADGSSSEAHFLLGNALAEKQRFNDAEKAYLRALELDPNHGNARSNLGVVYYRQSKLAEAEDTFRAALSQSPDDPEILYNLGGVLASLNRFDEAVTLFRKATAQNPDLPEPYLGLGSVFHAQGRRDEAISALRRYIELSDDAEWIASAEGMIRELGAQP